MKKQNFLCVDLSAHLQVNQLVTNECRRGVLTMTEADERFVFEEELARVNVRNPRLWAGKRLNVHKNRKGELIVNFCRTVLTESLDPGQFADEVFLDLERAKVELGL